MYEHEVGLMYKKGILEVTSEVRSVPINQKRKRGRPKKLPHCLTRSPAAAVQPSPTPDHQDVVHTLADDQEDICHAPEEANIRKTTRKRKRLPDLFEELAGISSLATLVSQAISLKPEFLS